MPTLEVLHADNHLLALAKPAGVPVVPDSSGDESLLEQAKAWIKREHGKPGRVFLGVVHHLGDAAMIALYPPFLARAPNTSWSRPFADKRRSARTCRRR